MLTLQHLCHGTQVWDLRGTGVGESQERDECRGWWDPQGLNRTHELSQEGGY